MSVYAERDAVLVVPLKSDDDGLTWYPVGGDPTSAESDVKNVKLIHMKTADGGTTWTSA